MGFYTLSYIGFALAQAAIALWGFKLWAVDGKRIGVLMILLPIATVWYDNLIIALGSFIGEGATLRALTLPRYLGHSFFTPAWIVGAAHLAERAGVFGGKARAFRIGSWVLYGLMVVVGLLNEVVFYRGEIATEGDVMFYTNVGRLISPPPPSLTMLLVVLICGALIMWKTRWRWPWVFVSALVVLGAQAARGGEAAFLFINLGEVAMSLALVATLWWLMRRRESQPAEG